MKEGIDTVSGKHLRKGVLPIRACAGSIHDFPDSYLLRDSVHYFDEVISKEDPEGKNWLTVDYYGSELWLERARIKNGGKYSYVISPVDSRNKISHRYADCTGVVGVGVDKETKEEISFLSHQDPAYFLRDTECGSFFEADLRLAITDLLQRSQKGTVDIVLFGGNMVWSVRDWKNYMDSIEFLDRVVYKTANIHPVVVGAPKRFSGVETAVFDTKKRRIFLMRQYQKEGIGESPVYRADNVRNEKHIVEYWKDV